MASILLIGAGQLGSRYLQGLVGSKFDLEITIIDPSLESLKRAKSRWNEAGGDESSHKIHWLESLPSSLQKVDVALIVTSSHGRANLIEKIANVIDIRYWVLEKVLAQSNDELNRIRSALSTCAGAWVNTPRRMMPWYHSLKHALVDRGPFTVSYSAGLWGLACNSIHFIDLVAWWSGQSLISIDTSGLDHRWFESVRAGYFEITGELVAYYSGGSSVRLCSNEGTKMQPIKVVLGNGIIWKIDESIGTAYSSGGERIDGLIEYQSQMSSRLVDNLLKSGECSLTTLKESCEMHAILLDSMLAHWNMSQDKNDELVPIT